MTERSPETPGGGGGGTGGTTEDREEADVGDLVIKEGTVARGQPVGRLLRKFSHPPTSRNLTSSFAVAPHPGRGGEGITAKQIMEGGGVSAVLVEGRGRFKIF